MSEVTQKKKKKSKKLIKQESTHEQSRKNPKKRTTSFETSNKTNGRKRKKYSQNDRDNKRKKKILFKRFEKIKRVFIKVTNILFYAVVTVIILGTLFMAANRDQETGTVKGYSWYNVATNSMVPSKGSPKGGFYAGDMIIVKQTPFEKLKVKDVVTYRVEGEKKVQLTHRIVSKTKNMKNVPGEYIVTKGDANESNDPPVTSDRIIGKVIFVIPKIGTIIFAIKKNWKIILLIIGTIWLIFFIYRKYKEKRR